MSEILSQMAEQAKQIFYNGINAVDPVAAIMNTIKIKDNKLYIQNQSIHLNNFNNVYVIGFGKASTAMLNGFAKLAGKFITKALVITKDGHNIFQDRSLSDCFSFPVEICLASHPVPDERGISVTLKIMSLIKAAKQNDIIICLISGGGSALLCQPAENISLTDMMTTTQLLLNCGATIHELNCVRKHISKIKGGQLSELAYPAQICSIILSDVIGDNLEVISSGPTVPDPTSYADAGNILKKYDLLDKIPISVKKHFLKHEQDQNYNIRSRNHAVFNKTSNHLIASNAIALKACEIKAKEFGYNTLILSDSIQGEARECAVFHAGIIQSVLTRSIPIEKPACIISGGENTVTIQGKGKGGRNQEFCLSIIPYISDLKNSVVISAGSDGNDGPTDAAGGIVTSETNDTVSRMGLKITDYLNNNDSYHLLKKCGCLLKTGPTNTNVMDIRIILINQ